MAKETEFISILREVIKEKDIDENVMFEALENALISACKKNYSSVANFKIDIDREQGTINAYLIKEIVEEVFDITTEISIDEVRQYDSKLNLGDFYQELINPRDFGRISAQAAKQVFVQKFREVEKSNIFNAFAGKENELISGIIERQEKGKVFIKLDKIEVVLNEKNQIPREKYTHNDRIKVVITEVKQTPKSTVINVSRTTPELVLRLFEAEVPEIKEGVVEIKCISREAGSRTKIAVHSNDPNVEAVGACVGQNGNRVNQIIRELHGEKIDIINWDEDLHKFITVALGPSEVLAVVLHDETRTARVVVPDDQLSLAIGKEGQNAKLVAKLTNYKIDIKSETQAVEKKFITQDEYENYLAIMGYDNAENNEAVVQEIEQE